MSDLTKVSENPKTARYGPKYPHYQNRPVETQARSGVEHVACPDVTQKPAHHARNSPKCRPAHGVLREIGHPLQRDQSPVPKKTCQTFHIASPRIRQERLSAGMAWLPATGCRNVRGHGVMRLQICFQAGA